MNKGFKNFKKKAIGLSLALCLTIANLGVAFADGSRVVTLGANLNPSQREQMLKYFGVNENQAVIIEVNNKEEREYLQGVATEEQLGKVTMSCSYVEPTKKGNGINVKTANLTWVTSAMIATTLSTAGIENANVIAAAPFPVSGTGALTGVMKAFEDATGKSLSEEKKELATEELVTTGDLGDSIGQDKATGVINDIKTEIIKNNTKDTVQIADTINNITNNYNVNLSDEQFKQIESLMSKIANQDYKYNEMKDTLENVSNVVENNLKDLGESIQNSGILDTIKGWFEGIGDWFGNLFSQDQNKDLGILENTNDQMLGENATINATDDKAVNLPSREEVEGFFAKVWNWLTGLFTSDEKAPTKESTPNNTTTTNDGSSNVENTTNNNTNSTTNEGKDIPVSNEENNNSQDTTNSENNSTEIPSQNTNQNDSSNAEIPPAQ